jgi:hypothetical protein
MGLSDKRLQKTDQCVAGGIGAMSHWAELAELLFVLSVRARSRIEARELPSRELDVNFWLSIGGKLRGSLLLGA